MKRPEKIACVFLLLVMIASLTAGCLDATQLDEYSYVMAIGVDVGEIKKYYVSFLIQMEGTTQQSEAGKGEMVLAAEGDSLFEAVTVAELTISDKLNFMRTNYVAFSLDVAKTQLMGDFLSASLNELGIRRSANLFVTLISCSDYFKGLNSLKEPSVAKRQYGLYISNEYTGLLPLTSLSLYKEAVSGGRFDVMVPTGSIDTSNETESGVESEKDGGGTEASGSKGSGTTAGVNRDGGLDSYPYGCAVFHEGYLAGVLNGKDTQFLLMASGGFTKGPVYYKNSESEYAFLLEALKTPKVVFENGETPRADITIVLTGRVEADTAGNIVYIWESSLKREFEQYIEDELMRVFLICRDMGSDVLGFGRYASMECANIRQWEETNWKERYKKMEVSFHVTVKPENTMITESRG